MLSGCSSPSTIGNIIHTYSSSKERTENFSIISQKIPRMCSGEYFSLLKNFSSSTSSKYSSTSSANCFEKTSNDDPLKSHEISWRKWSHFRLKKNPSWNDFFFFAVHENNLVLVCNSSRWDGPRLIALLSLCMVSIFMRVTAAMIIVHLRPRFLKQS